MTSYQTISFNLKTGPTPYQASTWRASLSVLALPVHRPCPPGSPLVGTDYLRSPGWGAPFSSRGHLLTRAAWRMGAPAGSRDLLCLQATSPSFGGQGQLPLAMGQAVAACAPQSVRLQQDPKKEPGSRVVCIPHGALKRRQSPNATLKSDNRE